MEALVILTREGPLRRVTLNRPQRHNALHGPLAEALDVALAEALADDAARVIVLAGAGRTFCAGLDLAGEGEAFRRAPGAAQAPFASAVARLMETGKPVVARVQGGAFGAGFGLMAACGLVVAAENTRFAVSELRFGLPPTLIPLVLQHTGRLGLSRHLLMTGAPFDTATALRCGLVHVSVAEAELDAALAAACADLLACAPGAYGAARALQRKLATLDFAEGLRVAGAAVSAGLDSAEGREGRAAWREGRPPRWAAE
jgi:enoyl-CoA hydratase/carnithine racemase